MSFTFEIREESDLSALLAVRWRNLYPDKVVDPSISKETDGAEGTIHFTAVRSDGRIGGCVTLAEELKHERPRRMRWLGVDESWRGRGVGSSLVKACLEISGHATSDIWCNARLIAIDFYRSLGFETKGRMFNIGDIGPHYYMFKDLL